MYAHGFLTVNGQKMSKSRGTLIAREAWLDHLPAEYLRYYFASRLGDGVDDLDLNLDDFVAKVNSDIVGKLVNIASRCAGFIARGSAARLADRLADPALQDEFVAAGERIAALYEGRDLAGAIREIMALTDRANLYIDQQKPWLMAKDPARAAEVQAVCTQGLNLFRVLALYLKPVMPRLAAGAEKFLALAPLTWADAAKPLLGTTIEAYEPLATRVDPAARQGAARGVVREPQARRRADGRRRAGRDANPRRRRPQPTPPRPGRTDGRAHLDRRVRQGRPAHRADRIRGARRRRRQAAASSASTWATSADARSSPASAPHTNRTSWSAG